jgi:GAF domain-containing protein
VEPLPPSAFDAGAVARAAAATLEDARQAIGVKRTALFWLDAAQGRLKCVATAGPGDRDRWVGQTLATNLGMAGRAVREGHPVWTPDLLADPRVPIAPWLRERLEAENLRTVAAAPVRVDRAISGALGFLDGPGRTYDERALERLGRLADEVAARVARTSRGES